LHGDGVATHGTNTMSLIGKKASVAALSNSVDPARQ
jgi:hypothetical protein